MKLSYIVAILTALQFIYIYLNIFGYYTNSEYFSFDIHHEDLIFILHLMTFFIVTSIEQAANKLKQ